MAAEDRSLHDLFASLRSSSSGRPQSASQQPARAEPRQQSSPVPDSTTDRTATLLSLLKFNQPSQQQPQQQQSQQQSAATNLHGRGVSTSDLVASYMGRPASSTREQLSTSPSGLGANPQDYLLQLLNRAQYGNEASPVSSPQPQQQAPHRASSSIKEHRQPTPDSVQRKDSPIRIFGSAESREHTPFEPQMRSRETSEKPLFTYSNPFEQLAASSPLNATPPTHTATSQKGSANSRRTPENKGQEKNTKPTSLSRQISATQPDDIIPSIESPTPDQAKPRFSPPGSRSVLGAPTTDTATVAQALNQVSEQVSRQADLALEQAERSSKRTRLRRNDEPEIKEALKTAAKEVKEELGPDPRKKLEKVLSPSLAGEVKKVVNEAAEGNVDGHGSADDEKSSANGEGDFTVPVYNFVMKPFVSIELTQKEPPTAAFREKTVTDIARLKKEFDQIDRTLATASSEYIIYSLPKSGGIRVIRQEDGADRHVFKETRDHVFNVALSTAPRGTPSSELQTSIATATSGTVYWTALYHNEDHIESKNIEDYCLTFPPVSANEEHTSGGQLKTRAKRSSRHPEFFAIGRGKTLQIVFPLHAAGSPHTSKKNVVNTETYFKDRSLKINTGKAGKDFTFSEDDTVVASLDKAGRMRFWDIRELVSSTNSDPASIDPVEILTPIITYSTAIPNEKSWPTSVLLVDKLRAYAKGTALRYAIVGMKQNHTLQLWDLGLGKAIQEVHFPHSKESDPICSVCYHPPSGIIVVAHPTRNSIYFIHLSAPKYNLSGISQANYMSMLAEKDESLPKPDSTAIMSGMREYSFASKGQLRSVDLLPISSDGTTTKDQPGLFELYIMHSKGVTMLSISREDLGWSDDMKVINSLSAQDAGLIRVSEIIQPQTAEASENSSISGDHSAHMKTSTADSSRRSTMKSVSKPPDDIEQRAPVNGAASDRSERRRKKKAGTTIDDSSSGAPSAATRPTTYAGVLGQPSIPLQAETSKDLTRTLPIHPPPSTVERGSGLADSSVASLSEALERTLPKVEAGISSEVARVFKQQFDSLHARLNDDRRAVESQHGANQEAMLVVISKTLRENVDNSLKRIISDSIHKDVIPAIKNHTVTVVQKDILNTLSKTVSTTVQEHLKKGILEATTKAIKDANVVQNNSQEISSGVSRQLSKDLGSLLDQKLPTALGKANTDMVDRLSSANKNLLEKHIEEFSAQRQADAHKIDKLLHTVQDLLQTVNNMELAHRQLRDELITVKNGQPAATIDEPTPPSETVRQVEAPEAASHEDSPYLEELVHIAETMEAGDFEDATVKWIQSTYQSEIFDNYFVNVDLEYLRDCSPLVTLSVAAAVTSSLQTNLAVRLRWLNRVLDYIDYEDDDIRDVAPRIMQVLCVRLESYYDEISDRDASDPSLKQIPQLTRRARDIAQKLQE